MKTSLVSFVDAENATQQRHESYGSGLQEEASKVLDEGHTTLASLKNCTLRD